MSSKQLLVAFVAIVMMAGFVTASTDVTVSEVALEAAPRGNISWVTNCGVRPVSNVTVDTCNSRGRGCVLIVNQAYRSGFRFTSTRNYTSLSLTVTANKGIIGQGTINQRFIGLAAYDVEYNLGFGSQYAASNVTYEQQNITVTLGNGTYQEVCARFDVYLNPSAKASGSVISISVLLLAIKQFLVYLNV